MIHWQGDHETPLEFVLAKKLSSEAPDLLQEVKSGKKRQVSKLKQGATSPVTANLPERENEVTKESRTEAAELVGASVRNVSDAKRIQN